MKGFLQNFIKKNPAKYRFQNKKQFEKMYETSYKKKKEYNFFCQIFPIQYQYNNVYQVYEYFKLFTFRHKNMLIDLHGWNSSRHRR